MKNISITLVMERSSTKCGYMTGKGKKCKNPSGSCRFHCKGRTIKAPRGLSSGEESSSPPKSTLKKGRSTPTSASPKKRGRTSKSSSLKIPPSPPHIKKDSDIDLLNNLPKPFIYKALLQIPRAELNEICKSASKLRIRGELTNIEKICRENRFQKEYALKHPQKEYPVILADRLDSVLIDHITSDLVNVTIDQDENNIQIVFASGWGIRIWKKGNTWFTDSIVKVGSIYYGVEPERVFGRDFIRKLAIEKTGRPDLFSKDAGERGRAVESLLRQIISEVEDQYYDGRLILYPFGEDTSPIENFFKKFGI
jgi:hypothetical protein